MVIGRNAGPLCIVVALCPNAGPVCVVVALLCVVAFIYHINNFLVFRKPPYTAMPMIGHSLDGLRFGTVRRDDTQTPGAV